MEFVQSPSLPNFRLHESPRRPFRNVPDHKVRSTKMSSLLHSHLYNNSQPKSSHKTNRKGPSDLSFVLALGTHESCFLLSHSNSTVSSSGQNRSPITRYREMSFDWTLANSCGGADGGHIILRVLSSDMRGMDLEYWVPLK